MSAEPLSRDAAALAHPNALIFQLCFYAVAGWVNRGQQQVIEYLIDENRVLREQPETCWTVLATPPTTNPPVDQRPSAL